MSISYPYTRDPFSVPASWPGQITLPSDGDPFTAGSVSDFKQPLADRTNFAMESVIRMNHSNNKIRAYCTYDFSGIGSARVDYLNIYPFVCQCTYMGKWYLTGSSILTTTKITPSLFEGTSPASNVWFYMYEKMTSATTSQRIVRTTVPDQYLAYMSNGMGGSNTQYKYLLAFRLVVSAPVYAISPAITKNGSLVLYDASFPQFLFSGSSPLSITTNVSAGNPLIPPHSKKLKIWYEFFSSTGTPSTAYAYLTPTATPGGIASPYPTIIEKNGNTDNFLKVGMLDFNIKTYSPNRLFYGVASNLGTGTVTGTIFLSLYTAGYYE